MKQVQHKAEINLDNVDPAAIKALAGALVGGTAGYMFGPKRARLLSALTGAGIGGGAGFLTQLAIDRHAANAYNNSFWGQWGTPITWAGISVAGTGLASLKARLIALLAARAAAKGAQDATSIAPSVAKVAPSVAKVVPTATKAAAGVGAASAPSVMRSILSPGALIVAKAPSAAKLGGASAPVAGAVMPSLARLLNLAKRVHPILGMAPSADRVIEMTTKPRPGLPTN
jgi:hypothetical protein